MPVDDAFKPLRGIISRLGRKGPEDRVQRLIEDTYRDECPSNEDLEALASHGVYEPIARAIALGCNVNEDLAWEALAYFTLTGDHRKARILIGHLGFKPSSSAGVALCNGGRRVLAVDGRVFDSMLIAGSWRYTGDSWLWNAARVLGIDAVAHWGCDDSPGVDLRGLQRDLLPEIDDTFTALLHGLGLNPDNIGRALEAVAGFFAWLTERIGHPAAGKLAAFKKYWKPCTGGQVMFTDSPRVDIKEYTPFAVDRNRISSMAAFSIHARGIDPYRAARILRDKGIHDIAAEIESAIVNRQPHRSRDECVQVVTSSGHWAPGMLSKSNVVFRCVEPLRKCILMPETRVGAAGRRVVDQARSAIRVLDRVQQAPEVEVYNAGVIGPRIVYVAARIARERGLNILVPSDAMKHILVEELGFVDAASDPDAPLKGSSIAASWSDVLEKPYLSSYRFLVVLPEVLVRGSPYSEMLASGDLEDIVSDVIGLVGRLGGVAVSAGLKGETIDAGPGDSSEVTMSKSMPVDLILAEAKAVFKSLWGADKELRAHQDFMLRILADSYHKSRSRIVMGVFPTGSGKSAIFQVAARAASTLGYGGYTLVVSPLKALMRDQVDNAIRRGLNALRVDSSVPPQLREKAFKAARLGLVDLLYVTPERFQDDLLVNLVRERPPALIVLDEAHTLSLWGSTFRPSYLYMAKILSGIAREKGWPPILLLTATAPEDLATDIMGKLSETAPVTVRVGGEVPESPDVPVIVRSSPLRDELVFDVLAAPRGDERIGLLASVVRDLSGFAEGTGKPWFGIVFTGFVRKGKRSWATIDAVGDALEKALNVPVIRYHGQLSPSSRRSIENKIYSILEEGGSAVIVATKAFGMGIDIPVIRWVVHYYPSDSMEDFYQEAGRAGRDGRRSIIVELFNPDDFAEKASMIRRQRIRPSIIVEAYNSIVKLLMTTRDDALVLPLDVLRGFGDDPLRILDSMREAGLLDYTLTRSKIAAYRAQPGAEALLDASYWTWKLHGAYYIGPEAALPGIRPVSYPKFVLCEGERGRVLRVEANQFVLAPDEGCGRTLRVAYGSRRDVAALVTLPPKPTPIDFLRPNEMQKILLSTHSMKKALDYLKETLEEALASKSIHGPEGADSVIKKRVSYYFEARRSKPTVDLADIAGIRTRCLSLERCIPLIMETVKDAVDAVGYSGVTLAVKSPRIASIINHELVSRGIRIRASEKAYKTVADASRDSLLKLMDYGYIIVVVDNPSVATERVIDRISEYPYSAIYIVDTI